MNNWTSKDWDFIQENLAADVDILRLAYAQKNTTYSDHIIQIKRWQKFRKKFPKIPFKRGYLLPPELSIEQASSSETAYYKACFMEGKNVVDVTGGMGMDGLEISKRAQSYLHIERDEEISISAQSLLGDGATCIWGESREVLGTLKEPIDVIYADPARRGDKGQKVIAWDQLSPNPIENLPLWKKLAEQVWIRLTPMTDLLEIKKAIPDAGTLHILGKGREAKEITVQINSKTSDLSLSVSIDSNPSHRLLIPWDQVNKTPSKTSHPKRYLYDPHSTLMISKAWDWICQQYNLSALHPKTRLFTSDELHMDFPGRVFEILGIHTSLPKSYKGKSLAIATQNHPVKAADLRKKLKAKESESTFLWATQSLKGVVYILAKKYR